MADLNACSVCGFTSNDLQTFESHVKLHEDFSDDQTSHQSNSPSSNKMNLSIKQEAVSAFMPTAANMETETQVNYMPTDISMDIESMISHLLNAKNILPLSVNTNTDEEPTKDSTCIPSSSSHSSIPSNDHSTGSPPESKFFIPEFDESIFNSSELKNDAKQGKRNGRRSDNRTKLPKTVHKCDYCDFQTVMSQHMKSHLEAHKRHKGEMFTCKICNMDFSQKANMHRHQTRHTGEKQFQCRFCKKEFYRKDQVSLINKFFLFF